MNTQERQNYIYDTMLGMIRTDSDLLVEICEELDSYNGFLGDDRCYYMSEIDDILYGKNPSDIIEMISSDFDKTCDFFYFSIYGLESCGDKADHYLDCFSDEDILDEYLKNGCHCNLSNGDFEELAELYDTYSDENTEDETDEEFMERIDGLS
jgi:hypothetical protein